MGRGSVVSDKEVNDADLHWAVVAAMVLVLPGRADADFLCEGIVLTVQTIPPRADRLKGRLLGGLIRKGMTMEQVNAILPCGCSTASCCSFGSTVISFEQYNDYGLTVSYRTRNSEVFRVTEVLFWNLFD
jgi:hypothetical protein